MRHLLPALVAAVLGASSAYADPPANPPFANKSFGDGGGYKHPDTAVGQFFETVPERTEEAKPKPKPEAAKPPSKPKPEMKPERPVAQRPSRPRPRPFVEPEIEIAASKGAPSKPALKAPPALPGAAVSTDDSASDDARRDYETRLFGAASGARRPGVEDPSPRASPAPLPPGAPDQAPAIGEGMLFVSLELDPKEAGTLRDAVAGLGAAAAFRADPRFQPLPGVGGSVRVSGWLPVSRLGDVISSRGVRSVAVERGSRPMEDNRLTGAYVLKVRLTEGAESEASAARKVRELTERTGFQLERVLAVETLTGGAANVVVSGIMPVSQLSRALGLPGVIDISSALPDGSAADAVSAPLAAPVQKEGFLRFVMARKLWLVLLTALLVLPAFGSLLKKGLAIFVPYR